METVIVIECKSCSSIVLVTNMEILHKSTLSLSQLSSFIKQGRELLSTKEEGKQIEFCAW